MVERGEDVPAEKLQRSSSLVLLAVLFEQSALTCDASLRGWYSHLQSASRRRLSEVTAHTRHLCGRLASPKPCSGRESRRRTHRREWSVLAANDRTLH